MFDELNDYRYETNMNIYNNADLVSGLLIVLIILFLFMIYCFVCGLFSSWIVADKIEDKQGNTSIAEERV